MPRTLKQLIEDAYADCEIQRYMYLSCLHWSLSNDDIFKHFKADTGLKFSAPKSALERMTDQACGVHEEFLRRFVEWFNADVWGLDPYTEDPWAQMLALENVPETGGDIIAPHGTHVDGAD